jgi:hypothetical protein
MLKKFISIFLSKLPDRFACLVIIICIIVSGSFAYETVGLPVGAASARDALTADSAANAAVGWVYMQKCFGDNIKSDTVVSSVAPAGEGSYHETVDFVALKYKVDMGSGELHHVPVNHTVAVLVSRGRVTAAAAGLRDLINDQVSGPVAGVSLEYV